MDGRTSVKLIDNKNEVVTFTFEYAPTVGVQSYWAKPQWKRSKKRFVSIEDAVRAAGLWMQVCYDNDWPIAIRLVELS